MGGNGASVFERERQYLPSRRHGPISNIQFSSGEPRSLPRGGGRRGDLPAAAGALSCPHSINCHFDRLNRIFRIEKGGGQLNSRATNFADFGDGKQPENESGNKEVRKEGRRGGKAEVRGPKSEVRSPEKTGGRRQGTGSRRIRIPRTTTNDQRPTPFPSTMNHHPVFLSALARTLTKRLIRTMPAMAAPIQPSSARRGHDEEHVRRGPRGALSLSVNRCRSQSND